MPDIGFVGLGNMGRHIASHLGTEASELTVYDIREDAMQPLIDEGAKGAPDVTAVAEASDIVFLSLPDPDAVVAVVEELEDGFAPGSTLVDTSTSTPGTTESIASLLAAKDVTVFSAPVSGGTTGARNATLTTMVGGPSDGFQRYEPLFESYASDVFHVGEQPGSGHAMKLLNNYLSFLALIGTSEAVALGQKAGLDTETMVDVFSVSSGRNSATDDKFPNYIMQNEDVGFKLGLMNKDISLLTSFADEKDAPALLAGVVDNLTHYIYSEYGGDDDMTRAYDFVKDKMES